MIKEDYKILVGTLIDNVTKDIVDTLKYIKKTSPFQDKYDELIKLEQQEGKKVKKQYEVK